MYCKHDKEHKIAVIKIIKLWCVTIASEQHRFAIFIIYYLLRTKQQRQSVTLKHIIQTYTEMTKQKAQLMKRLPKCNDGRKQAISFSNIIWTQWVKYQWDTVYTAGVDRRP